MKILIFTLILITSVSCKKGNGIIYNNIVEKETTESINISVANSIQLGENIDEINAYLKNIYSLNEKVYVDIDIVQIKYINVDEREVINENTKIRTYEIDAKTLIYSNDCKTLKRLDLIKLKDNLLNNKSLILVGESENGKMLSINFGCYG